MAESPEDQVTIEKKISEAKELFGRGSRNFYVQAFDESAEDLSKVCAIYSEIYGPKGDELGMPYLLYAKSLISVAQDENKLMDIPEEKEDDDDDDEDGADEIPNENGEKEKMAPEEKDESEAGPSTANGHGVVPNEPDSDESQPETNGDDVKDGEEHEEEDEVTATLQVAWEVLELAVMIFERQGARSTLQLAEAYSELANISLENGHFEIAIKDYKKSLDTYTDLPEPNRRVLAEIQYKVGLCYIMLEESQEAVKSMHLACSFLTDEIEEETAKTSQSDAIKANIKDLEDTKLEIMNKITEVEESNKQSMAELKMELSKLMGDPRTDDGAGTSAEANKPKPMDISHLIKRKKPETPAEVEEVKAVSSESSPTKSTEPTTKSTESSTNGNNIKEVEKTEAVKRKQLSDLEEEPPTKKPSI